jgi:hypothetical protein
MTREQLIVLGVVAGAYVAGWATAALFGWLTRRRLRAAPAGQPAPVPGPAAAEEPLFEEVAHALEDDAANESMLSVFRSDPAAELSDLEMDLADWGFTYGVAWERARRRDAGDSPDAVAAEALRTADEVFRAYTEDAAQTAHSPSPRTTS